MKIKTQMRDSIKSPSRVDKVTRILPFCLSTLVASGQSQLFRLSDYLAPDGSGVVVGDLNTGNSPSDVETTGNYRQSDGVAGDPSFYNAILVGSNYGGSDVYRSVLNYDLSSLPAAPSGFTYRVTDLSLVLEVSGGTNDGRPATLINFYEGSFEVGVLPSAANASVLFNSPNRTFVTTSLGAPILDLNTDSSVSITLDAPNTVANPGGNFYTFGSGGGPNIGFGGTNAIQLAPELRLSFDLVQASGIPETSSTLLLFSSLIVVLGVRRRRI